MFAIFVVFSHSYDIAGQGSDWLYRATGNQVDFSYLGLRGFFIISGFLVYQSLTRSESLGEYFVKRSLRIFPGLITLLLCTIVLVGVLSPKPMFSSLHNPQVWSYVLNTLSLTNATFTVPGIFDSNPIQSMNGSLWTLRIEFTFYLLLSILFFVRSNRQRNLLMAAGLAILMICAVFFYDDLRRYIVIISVRYFMRFGTYFIAGALLASIGIQQFRYRKQALWASLILFGLSLYFKVFMQTQYLIYPFVVILLGCCYLPFLSRITDITGDLSYGIYIYAFPIQQLLMLKFHFDAISIFTTSLAVTSVIAYFSWHLIEKHALELKHFIISPSWADVRVFGLRGFVQKRRSALTDVKIDS